MSATAIKALLLTFVLTGAVQGHPDHTRHNCCANDGSGWRVQTGWTQTACNSYKGQASFDGTTCNGGGINGEDFYNTCKSVASNNKYAGQAGAGYRGTCS